MNLRRSFAIYCGLGLALCCGLLPLQGQERSQFRIAGTVINADSGRPLPQTRVWIYNVKNPEALQALMTSENGRFEFNQLGPAKYSLQGMRHGFITTAYDAHEEYATAIVTGAGIDTENLTLKLTPAAVLAGNVLDESGEPVRGATVTLYREDHSAGVSRVEQINASGTDDLGGYEFSGLEPGNYFVSATAKPWYAVHPASSGNPGTPDLPATVDPSLDVAYPTTYFPDATDADQAPPIPIRGGDHLQIQIRVSPVPALRLRFRIPDQGRNGFVAQPTLGKRAFDSEQYIPDNNLQTISPGVYELTGVPAGRYDVHMGTGSGQIAQSDVDLVNDGQDLDSVAGLPVSSVRASVQILGESDLPEQFQLALSNAHRTLAVNRDLRDGRFGFEDIDPGKYTVLAFAQGTGKAYAVAKISSQGTEIPGHTIDAAPGSNLEIAVSLAVGTANVEGFAKRAGKGTSGAMIVLVPDDPENHRELFRRDQSDLDGSFTLPNVIPGKYTILAIENGWDLDWSQPAVIMQYAKHGQLVKVGFQAKGSVHVPEPVEIQSK
jgi:hypothetical protein